MTKDFDSTPEAQALQRGMLALALAWRIPQVACVSATVEGEGWRVRASNVSPPTAGTFARGEEFDAYHTSREQAARAVLCDVLYAVSLECDYVARPLLAAQKAMERVLDRKAPR